MKINKKFLYFIHLPSSSHFCIESQTAKGNPICKLGNPLVNGSIRVNQLCISGVKSFGKSAPANVLYQDFNLTSDNVVKIAKKMLNK